MNEKYDNNIIELMMLIVNDSYRKKLFYVSMKSWISNDFKNWNEIYYSYK